MTNDKERLARELEERIQQEIWKAEERLDDEAKAVLMDCWSALSRPIGDEEGVAAECNFGDLVNSCFASIGDAEPFVVERKKEFISARVGTALGSCTQLSAWLMVNKDHPLLEPVKSRALAAMPRTDYLAGYEQASKERTEGPDV